MNAKVIITGSVSDASLAKQIKQAMRNEPYIACGVFNIKQLGALSKAAGLFITADTGPLHIATAVGAKQIIALFGPTAPAITGPFPLKNIVLLHKDVGCKIPCYKVNCKESRCMKAIKPDEVFEQAKNIRNG